MAWDVDALKKLEKAYQSGVLEVEYEDQKTRYRSLQDMRDLIEEARLELYGQSPTWKKVLNPVFRR